MKIVCQENDAKIFYIKIKMKAKTANNKKLENHMSWDDKRFLIKYAVNSQIKT